MRDFNRNEGRKSRPSTPILRHSVFDPSRTLNRREMYIQAQVLNLAASRHVQTKYGGVDCDEKDFNWVRIRNYPLPSRWKNRRTSLLIWFPSPYPDTPPTGFYLDRKLELGNGSDHHYINGSAYDAPNLTEQGWNWYCVKVLIDCAGGWKPSVDPLEPDNLWTFLNLIREVLTDPRE